MSSKKINWEGLYQEFLSSNLSIKAFAKKKKVSSSCAYSHFKEFSIAKSTTIASDVVDLVPVELVKEECKPAQAKAFDEEESEIIISMQDFKILVPSNVNKSTLKTTLEVLKSLC